MLCAGTGQTCILLVRCQLKVVC